MPHPVVAVVGPTGTGKSELAMTLALRLGGEIINTDALQFYRGMDIGTAKVPEEKRRGIPHHLLDVLDVTQEASVAVFQDHARRTISEVQARGAVPVLVGGSGLYVRAVLDDIEFPPTDPAIRVQLGAWAEQSGSQAVRQRLDAVDPESAAKITDTRRMVRALEVHQITGRTFTSFMPERIYHQDTVQIGLDMDRETLNPLLHSRVQQMYDAGLVSEVEGLLGQGLREGKTASAAIGYRQALAVIDGDESQERAIQDTVIGTRRFAKRQRTWFRADPRVDWFDPRQGMEKIADHVTCGFQGVDKTEPR